MKEMREMERGIEGIVEKLKEQEKAMAAKKGYFDLFALFLRDDAPEKWDLLVAADWIEANKKASLDYIMGVLKKGLLKEEWMKLSRVVVINESNPALQGLRKAIGSARGIRIRNSNFFGLQIKDAYVITLGGKRVQG